MYLQNKWIMFPQTTTSYVFWNQSTHSGLLVTYWREAFSISADDRWILHFLSLTEWGFIEQVLGALQKNYFVMNIIQFEIFDYEFHQA